MPSLTKPGPAEVAALLALQAPLPFTYPDVGATRGAIPPGRTIDHHRTRLGSGLATFDRAGAALVRWERFRLRWGFAEHSMAAMKRAVDA